MKIQKNNYWSYDRVTDDGGTVWKVHKSTSCAGTECAIHNPSDHPLKDAPLIIRGDSFKYGLAERFCSHGIGHSDPDSVAFYAKEGTHGMGVHGCDGCCNGTYEEIQNG